MPKVGSAVMRKTLFMIQDRIGHDLLPDFYVWNEGFDDAWGSGLFDNVQLFISRMDTWDDECDSLLSQCSIVLQKRIGQFLNESNADPIEQFLMEVRKCRKT